MFSYPIETAGTMSVSDHSNIVKRPMSAEDGMDFSMIELFFFAYRDFLSDPDLILLGYGFGRAHHRALHFINRRPGLTVAELLDLLRITKQSLARVLKQLIGQGYIHQITGTKDRRQRHLYPTPNGRSLALQLAEPQSRRIRAALKALPEADRASVEAFLHGLLDARTREKIGRTGV